MKRILRDVPSLPNDCLWLIFTGTGERYQSQRQIETLESTVPSCVYCGRKIVLCIILMRTRFTRRVSTKRQGRLELRNTFTPIHRIPERICARRELTRESRFRVVRFFVFFFENASPLYPNSDGVHLFLDNRLISCIMSSSVYCHFSFFKKLIGLQRFKDVPLFL